MGSPIAETIIINRAPSRAFYGRQVAPVMNRTYSETVYDRLSPQYDDRYSTDAYLKENAQLFNALTPFLKGSLLDVGCGTGLLLEYFPTSPFMYLGIDPSQGMMNEFIRKFPSHAFRQKTFDEFEHAGQFDTAIALFGSPSYINPDSYEKLRDIGKSYYFMFYKEGYFPDYYTSPDQTNTNYKRIEQVFENTHIFGNYLIASNIQIEGTYESL
jgi:SAM-dependent methyltransferase